MPATDPAPTGKKGRTSWRCEGYGRYALRCGNQTTHESRFCGHHRNQTHWDAIVNEHGEQGVLMVRPTRTRWAVEVGIFYGGRWNWEQRRYLATEAQALVVRDEWATQYGSKGAQS